MTSLIVPVMNFVMFILKLVGVSKEKQDKLKRQINVHIKDILKKPSNSTVIRDQYKKATKDADDYLKGGD